MHSGSGHALFSFFSVPSPSRLMEAAGLYLDTVLDFASGSGTCVVFLFFLFRARLD